MTTDALNPGPGWRLPDGSPDSARMPQRVHWQRTPDGRRVLVNVTPRDPSGVPIVPPPITPAPIP